MNAARFCRFGAWIIVVLAAIDPPVPVRSSALPAVVVEGPSDVMAALSSGVSGRARVTPIAESPPAAFVFVGPRPPADLPALPGVPVHTVFTGSAPGPHTVRASVPARTIVGLPAQIQLQMHRPGPGDQTTELVLLKDGVQVDHAEHEWTGESREATRSLTFLPVSGGPQRLTIQARTDGMAPAGNVRDVLDVLLDVTAEPIRVHLAAPRASWALAFVKQALETDERLSLSFRIGTTPGAAVASERTPALHMGAEGRAGEAGTAGVDVLVAGGLDRLTAAEIRSARAHAEGGGVVVIVADGDVPPPVREWLGADRFVRRLLAAPVKTSEGWRASEWLFPSGLTPAASVLETVRIGSDDVPAVIEAPLGRGRVLYCAALDAWRFRGDPAFSRFWRALVTEAAAQRLARAAMRIEPAVTRPLSTVRVSWTGEARAIGDTLRLAVHAPDGQVTTATLVAVDRSLWTSTIAAPEREGIYRLSADRIDSLDSHFLVARDALAAAEPDETALRLFAAAHGGTFVRQDDLGALVARLRETPRPAATRQRRRPMRWHGWAAVLAVLLGTEWWIRRRSGLR